MSLESCKQCQMNPAIAVNVARWGGTPAIDEWGQLSLCATCLAWLIAHLLGEIRDWSNDERLGELREELGV